MSDNAMPIEAFKEHAYLNRLHVDGPLLSWAGQMHWLTIPERLALLFRLTTTDKIAEKRFRGYAAARMWFR